MIDNHYKGEVTINLNGEDVTLRFTWGTRAMLRSILGENWIERVSTAITSYDAGDLAVILEAASDGKITIAQVLENDWPMNLVTDAIRRGFNYSLHGLTEPEMEDKKPKNALSPQKTQFKMLTKILSVSGLGRKTFGA